MIVKKADNCEAAESRKVYIGDSCEAVESRRVQIEDVVKLLIPG